ncbi:MAG: hypothetical protein CVT48_02615 [Thermoplasmata archaeon HGW-Thermoplasmata-1]|nr:MAG: hypothetical protein CVT48_02615 [Thermoplasmata archaeon HGW-Thermoplasmata-1]
MVAVGVKVASRPLAGNLVLIITANISDMVFSSLSFILGLVMTVIGLVMIFAASTIPIDAPKRKNRRILIYRGVIVLSAFLFIMGVLFIFDISAVPDIIGDKFVALINFRVDNIRQMTLSFWFGLVFAMVSLLLFRYSFALRRRRDEDTADTAGANVQSAPVKTTQSVDKRAEANPVGNAGASNEHNTESAGTAIVSYATPKTRSR